MGNSSAPKREQHRCPEHAFKAGSEGGTGQTGATLFVGIADYCRSWFQHLCQSGAQPPRLKPMGIVLRASQELMRIAAENPHEKVDHLRIGEISRMGRRIHRDFTIKGNGLIPTWLPRRFSAPATLSWSGSRQSLLGGSHATKLQQTAAFEHTLYAMDGKRGGRPGRIRTCDSSVMSREF